MSSDFAIRLNSVSKAYPIYARREDRLKQLMLGWGKTYYKPFWALQDINLEIARGECFGLIGRNGSGKSTLLQIVAGTMAPTSGDVKANGRIGALLELGAGFNPEFSGRENVFLNAAILGLSRGETEARFDDIAAFADIGEFLDRPVKQYSSGMFMRLAFAVQAHIAADIMIVDEALAVGDVFFRQKCYRRLAQLQADGSTILIVSHSMGEIEQHCARAAVLDHGLLAMTSEASRAIKHYYLLEQQERLRVSGLAVVGDGSVEESRADDAAGAPAPPESQFPMEHVKQFNAFGTECVLVALTDTANEARRVFRCGETAVFTYEFVLGKDVHGLYGGMVLHAETGTIAHGKNSVQTGDPLIAFAPAGARIRVRQEIQLNLAEGDYTFEVGIAALPTGNAAHMTVAEFDAARVRLSQVPKVGAFQVIWASQRGIEALPHYGLANLPGAVSVSVVEAPAETALVGQ